MNKLVTTCLLCLGITCLDAAAYICTQPVLNMHREAKELSEVVSQVLWAESVEAVDENDHGWVKVSSADGQEGWVRVDGLALQDGAVYPNPAKTALVTSRIAHVYLVRDVKMYPPILSLPYGAKLEVLRGFDVQAERWAEVQLINGEVAYVQRSDITINPQPLAIKDALEFGKSLVNTPYTWGGRSIYGCDSAGLAQLIYRQMGITLARTPSEQANMREMKRISVDELIPGDLLFFSLTDDGQIDHTAIYLGNREFLHASARNTPPSIQIGSLKTAYWQASLKFACHYER